MVLIIKTLFFTYETALAALLSNILAFIIEKVGDQECMKKSIETAKKALATLNDAINKSRKNEFTEQINDADAFRDSLYRALCLRIDSDMLCVYDPALVERATLLNNIMIENGRTMEKAALEQSNQLDSLFVRFDKVIDTVKNNGIDILYDNIKIAEQKFISLSNAGTESAKNKKEMPWVHEAADKAMDTFNETLFKRLDIEAQEQGEPEPFKSVISSLNIIIEEAHKIQRARISRNESGTADNGPGNNSGKDPNDNKSKDSDADNTGKEAGNSGKNTGNKNGRNLTIKTSQIIKVKRQAGQIVRIVRIVQIVK